MIPEDWRDAPSELRQALLRDVIRGFLELDRNQDESLLLVADPPLAALLFLGSSGWCHRACSAGSEFLDI